MPRKVNGKSGNDGGKKRSNSQVFVIIMYSINHKNLDQFMRYL